MVRTDLEGEGGLEDEDREAGGLTHEAGGFQWRFCVVCVYAIVLMWRSKIYAVAKVSICQLSTAVSNHSTASNVYIRPLRVYIFQLCETYTSSWTSNFVLHLSKCCKNLAQCDCFFFAIFTVPSECSAPCCALLSTILEVHELGISLNHRLRISFVVSLPSPRHSAGRKLERKRQIFSVFS